MSAAMRNALTCDVEDYFHVSAFAAQVRPERWPQMESRVEANVERLLSLFAEAGVSATFFVLGWVAARHPRLVRRMAQAGHEIASHGYAHLRANQQARAEFRHDVERSKALLEDITGAAVAGYRAPSFSIGRDSLWALEVLGEAGYRYSSSIYPIAHDHYGMAEAPRFAFRPTQAMAMLEIPITTCRVGGRNLPAGGGGYFRLFPYAVSRWMLGQVNKVDRQPAVFYFHPWELDPAQPRIEGARWRSRFRHYLNLRRTEGRIGRLLDDFAWDRMDRVFADALA